MTSATTANFSPARFHQRSIATFAWTVLTLIATAIALLPLLSIVYVLVRNGAHHLNWKFFTQAAAEGGVGHALLGTLVMVGLASLLVIPVGTLAAVYLAEFGKTSPTAEIIRFAVRVLAGIPSILTGVFAYSLVVITTKSFSAYAGALALALLMVPTVVLTAEQALLAVSPKLREAAFGLGSTPTQVVLRVVIPTAWPAMVTGVLLSIARAAGETAPLLFTAFSSRHWIDAGFAPFRLADWVSSLNQPTASMSVLIYNYSSQADDLQKEQAWAAALVLVFAVLLVNLFGRVWSANRNN